MGYTVGYYLNGTHKYSAPYISMHNPKGRNLDEIKYRIGTDPHEAYSMEQANFERQSQYLFPMSPFISDLLNVLVKIANQSVSPFIKIIHFCLSGWSSLS